MLSGNFYSLVWVSHCGLLHKQRPIGVGQFLSIVLELISDTRQSVHLDGKFSASVDVVSVVPQGSVLGPLLFILYTSELFHIIGNHIVGYADDTKTRAVIIRSLSRPQVIKSLKQKIWPQSICGV